MFIRKFVTVVTVLVLSVCVYASDKKTASGIELDKEWKVKIYEYSKKNHIHTSAK